MKRQLGWENNIWIVSLDQFYKELYTSINIQRGYNQPFRMLTYQVQTEMLDTLSTITQLFYLYIFC